MEPEHPYYKRKRERNTAITAVTTLLFIGALALAGLYNVYLMFGPAPSTPNPPVLLEVE